MRILWITNNPIPEFLPEIHGTPALGGSWIVALAEELSSVKGIKLAVVTNIAGGKHQKLVHKTITQYCIPIDKRNGLVINDLYPELVVHYQNVINDFSPDVIHMHGTERYFGLLSARDQINKPVVISIQGTIVGYYNYLLGGIPEKKLLTSRSIKNLLSQGGILNQRKQYGKYIEIEKEILTNNKYWFCRTTWDRSQVIRYNPGSVIFQGEELLRKAFYETRWSHAEMNRHSVFISSGTIPIKGFHVLIKAASILKREYPDLIIQVPLDARRFDNQNLITSNDYEIYLNDLITKYSLRNNIKFLGKLTEHQMAATLASSHVFVLPSFNENSPNSLGEAMMVGTPSVVAPVGGVPDMVTNNVSALYAPSGDAGMLAYQIQQIFDNDELAIHLSENAKQTALKRHDVQSTISQYCNAYANILERENTNIARKEAVHAVDR